MIKDRNNATFAREGKLYNKDVTITLIPLILLILLKGLSNLIVLRALIELPPTKPYILKKLF